jgi:hypothetical protein
LISAATVIALVVAVIAFIALDQADEEAIPRDAYTIAADRMCIAAKDKIVAVERGGIGAEAIGTAAVARHLLPVVAEWRSEFDALRVPADRVREARDLDGALQEVELRIGALARAAGEGDRKKTLVRARGADEASTGVEKAVSALGLSRCSRLTIGLTQE